MISSASSPDRTPRADLVSAPSQSAPRPYAPRPDSISTESAANLRAALARQPEVRPEVVARARTLAADPNYPSPQIMKRIAQQIVASPDLSEDES